jgi:hypothetical protein
MKEEIVNSWFLNHLCYCMPRFLNHYATACPGSSTIYATACPGSSTIYATTCPGSSTIYATACSLVSAINEKLIDQAKAECSYWWLVAVNVTRYFRRCPLSWISGEYNFSKIRSVLCQPWCRKDTYSRSLDMRTGPPSLLRGSLSCSSPRISQHFMEPGGSLLSQMNPVCTTPCYFCKTHLGYFPPAYLYF